MGRISAFLGIILYMYPEKVASIINRIFMLSMVMRNVRFPYPTAMCLPDLFLLASYEMSRHSLTCAKQN